MHYLLVIKYLWYDGTGPVKCKADLQLIVFFFNQKLKLQTRLALEHRLRFNR